MADLGGEVRAVTHELSRGKRRSHKGVLASVLWASGNALEDGGTWDWGLH